MEDTLQKRIKSVIAKTGMTYKQLAIELGVSVDNLYKWKGSSNPRNYKDHEKLYKGLDRLLEHNPETNAAEPQVVYKSGALMNTSKPVMVSINLEQDEEPELYTGEKAIPGAVLKIHGKPALIAYRNDSVVIGSVHGLISVTGNSMAPEYKSGSWIAITRLQYNKILVAGNCYYIIDKNKEGILRKIRLVEGGKGIELISADAENYPSFTRTFDDILAIFKVEAVIIKQ